MATRCPLAGLAYVARLATALVPAPRRRNRLCAALTRRKDALSRWQHAIGIIGLLCQPEDFPHHILP